MSDKKNSVQNTTTNNNETNAENAPKKKAKFTFMLHDPQTRQAIAKLSSTDYRFAALKAASRMNKLPESTKGEEEGTVNLWLRRTNTKQLREYIGRVVTLDKPQEVVRQGRTITYTKRPQVKFVRQWVWDDTPTTNEDSDNSAVTSVPDL